MSGLANISERIRGAVRRDRLLETAIRLVDVPSPTGRAGPVADRLGEMLASEGFAVERPPAGHPAAPAVVAELRGSTRGRCLQFNGHLDVVHLPFVPPRVEGNRLRGSGSCDMKGGLAAAIEALRALRDASLIRSGRVLLTAHDTHEAPWGFGEQLDGLIADGFVGDAVLIPEPLNRVLPTIGRGQACWKATIRRSGPPVHEVMRPLDEPSVLYAGGRFLRKLSELEAELARRDPDSPLRESVFVGQFHGGEIYNQFPQECWLEGTRRWLPESNSDTVEAEFRGLVSEVARASGASIELDYHTVRPAFSLDPNDPVVSYFGNACEQIMGERLTLGSKPFVDDGNLFWTRARRPAITHGPEAGGQHTTEEWVDIDDLVRVARVYAITAAQYCSEAGET